MQLFKISLFIGLGFFLSMAKKPNSFAVDKLSFTSKEGKFSINFKQVPKESSENVPTGVGDIKMFMFMYEASNTKAYMVAYCDYPIESVNSGDPMTLLNGAKNGVVGQFESVITSETTGKFMGNPCIDFTASGQQYHTSYKLILVKNRLYQVGILQDKEPVAKDDTKSFIGSFKLLK